MGAVISGVVRGSRRGGARINVQERNAAGERSSLGIRGLPLRREAAKVLHQLFRSRSLFLHSHHPEERRGGGRE